MAGKKHTRTEKIELTKGKVALVDEQDYWWLVALGRWQAFGGNSTWYAKRGNGGGGTEYMHALILGAPGVDHINGDGLDNRRSNLRHATLSQNQANRRSRADSMSGYKGVSWHKQRRRWYARICVNGQTRGLGLYESAEDAALAYDAAAIASFGEFAATNFPVEGHRWIGKAAS